MAKPSPHAFLVGRLPRTPRLVLAVKFARTEAEQATEADSATALLLALAHERTSVAGQILSNLGVNEADLRRATDAHSSNWHKRRGRDSNP
jgi:ATP-dependent Clp protease ATP-binding subunit ClpA